MDIKPQKRYPFTFIQGDALEYPLDHFDFVWASPICKGHTCLKFYGTNNGCEWPNQIPPMRARLSRLQVPWCMENVQRAPLETDAFLCGQMFGLPLIRHRLFETNFAWLRLPHICARRGSTRLPYDHPRRVYTVAGYGNGHSRSNKGMAWRKPEGMRALGINWMIRAEMVEAIPPAYSEFIARQVRF